MLTVPMFVLEISVHKFRGKKKKNQQNYYKVYLFGRDVDFITMGQKNIDVNEHLF